MVWNLLSNAVKFTPRDGRVQVRLERVNSHVEIVVSDTGIGIPPEFLPHVFERFRQADAGTTRKTGGLGLGLAIVRHIVEMHGGTVEADERGRRAGCDLPRPLPLMIVHPQRERRSCASIRGRSARARLTRARRICPASACWPSTTRRTRWRCCGSCSRRPAPR